MKKIFLASIFFTPFLYFSNPNAAGFTISIDRFLIFFLCLGSLFYVKKKIPCPNRFLIAFIIYTILLILILYVKNFRIIEALPAARDLSIFRRPDLKPFFQWIAFIFYAFAPYYFSILLLKNKEDIAKAIKVFMWAAILMTIFGLYQFLACYLHLPYNMMSLWNGRHAAFRINGICIFRIYSLGGEPKQFGAFLCVAVFLFVASLLNKQNLIKINKFNTYLLLSIMFLCLLLTVSLSVYFATAIILFILFLKYRNKKVSYKALVPTTMCLVLFFIFKELIVGGILFRMKENNLFNLIAPGGNLSERASIYFFTHKFFQDPLLFLFGVGYGSGQVYITQLLNQIFNLTESASGNDSRIFLLKLLMEVGVIGFSLYICFFLSIFKKATRYVNLYPQFKENIIFLEVVLLFSLIVSFSEISFYCFLFAGLLDAYMRSIRDFKFTSADKPV